MDWQALFEDEAACKARQTCRRLGVRELYFEPNPGTLQQWQERHGFYRPGLDRRVVFVAENPSDRRSDPPDFLIGDMSGWRCWDYTSQDRRFRGSSAETRLRKLPR